ncbi:hypothetical protein AgCh_009689 [Apium graveolens]
MSQTRYVYEKNNFVALVNKEIPASGDYHKMMDLIQSCKLSYAMLESPIIYCEVVEEVWTTATFNSKDKTITFSLKGKEHCINCDALEKCFKLPENNTISPHIDTDVSNMLISMSYALTATKLGEVSTSVMYELGSKLGDIKKSSKNICYARFFMMITNFISENPSIENPTNKLDCWVQERRVIADLNKANHHKEVPLIYMPIMEQPQVSELNTSVPATSLPQISFPTTVSMASVTVTKQLPNQATKLRISKYKSKKTHSSFSQKKLVLKYTKNQEGSVKGSEPGEGQGENQRNPKDKEGEGAHTVQTVVKDSVTTPSQTLFDVALVNVESQPKSLIIEALYTQNSPTNSLDVGMIHTSIPDFPSLTFMEKQKSQLSEHHLLDDLFAHLPFLSDSTEKSLQNLKSITIDSTVVSTPNSVISTNSTNILHPLTSDCISTNVLNSSHPFKLSTTTSTDVSHPLNVTAPLEISTIFTKGEGEGVRVGSQGEPLKQEKRENVRKGNQGFCGWTPSNEDTTVKPPPPVMNSGELVLSKKMARLRRTARKSVPGGPYRIEGFRLPEQNPSSGSYSDLEVSLTGTPVDPIPPSLEEPVYVSSDPEEDPSESSEIPMHISPSRLESETPALEPESEMPKIVSVSVGGKLAQDRDFVYSRIPELGALMDRLIRDSRQRTSVVMEEWRARIQLVEQVARRRLDKGPSTSDADVEARRLHKIIRWIAGEYTAEKLAEATKTVANVSAGAAGYVGETAVTAKDRMGVVGVSANDYAAQKLAASKDVVACTRENAKDNAARNRAKKILAKQFRYYQIIRQIHGGMVAAARWMKVCKKWPTPQITKKKKSKPKNHVHLKHPLLRPEMNPETTMMSRLAQLLQQPVAPKVGNFKHFQYVHSPEFLGFPNPIKAQSWLREMEKAFELVEVKDEKKAQYASYYLKDEASFWWESSKALLEGKDLSWEMFTEMFLEKYLPSYMQDQLEMKFLDLRQEDMSVAEYEVKFSELSRFIPGYVNTEMKKAKRFQQGLRPYFRSQVALLEIKNYAALVQKAMIVEGEREVAKRENKGRKRKFESSVRRHPRRCNKLDVTYFKCNQKGHYSSECINGAKKPDLACFKCGKVGHMARNYKEPVQKANVLRIAGPPPLPTPTAQPRARTFNMAMKGAMQDVDVVAGMLVINSVEVKVLMDSGATRSFISESILDRLNCVAYPLEPNLIIEVANLEKVIIDKVCPDCVVVIEGRHFSADLIPFKLGEFDVILGMDYLSNHEAQIECKRKKVRLKTKDGDEVIFKGKRQANKFLTAIEMRRLLRQGCEVYLAHVKYVEKESVRIEDISVVRDFPDVFPDELP